MAGTRLVVSLLGAAALLSLALVPPCSAQEPRLEGRIPGPSRRAIDAVLDSARAAGLPTEPLVDRALEGAAKGADPDRIVAAVRRLRDELALAYTALGPRSLEAEVVAGASALRAGARPEDLAYLRDLRADQPLTVAAATLADLVAVGVPVDTAVAAVIALAEASDDAQYIAFRRNVERDIALGASPVAALGVRLEGLADFANRSLPQRPRKP